MPSDDNLTQSPIALFQFLSLSSHRARDPEEHFYYYYPLGGKDSLAKRSRWEKLATRVKENQILRWYPNLLSKPSPKLDLGPMAPFRLSKNLAIRHKVAYSCSKSSSLMIIQQNATYWKVADSSCSKLRFLAPCPTRTQRPTEGCIPLDGASARLPFVLLFHPLTC